MADIVSSYNQGSVQSEGRNASFEQGLSGGPQISSSLQQVAQAQNSMVGPFNPKSVLDAYQHPGFHPMNGNSSADVQRQTPGGQMPTMNGSSPGTYNALNPSYRTRLAT